VNKKFKNSKNKFRNICSWYFYFKKRSDFSYTI